MKGICKFFLFVVLMGIAIFGIFAQGRGGQFEPRVVDIVDAHGVVVGQFAEAHALVIGESEYTNGWRRLPGVKEDFAAIKTLFEEQGFNVETLENANSQGLKSGITNFLDKYGYRTDARLVLYFAGHGETLDLDGQRMGYIVPVDAPYSRNNRNQINDEFLQKAVPMAQFEAWAVQYRSRHILFVFDSCFAGAVFRSQGAEPPAINRLISYPVRQFITSGDANEEVPDESIFRREFVHAIRNGAGDLNKDGYISGTELGLYLFDKVSNYMEGKQNPRVGKLNNTNFDKGDFIFITGEPRNFSGTAQPATTAAKNEIFNLARKPMSDAEKKEFYEKLKYLPDAVHLWDDTENKTFVQYIVELQSVDVLERVLQLVTPSKLPPAGNGYGDYLTIALLSRKKEQMHFLLDRYPDFQNGINNLMNPKTSIEKWRSEEFFGLSLTEPLQIFCVSSLSDDKDLLAKMARFYRPRFYDQSYRRNLIYQLVSMGKHDIFEFFLDYDESFYGISHVWINNNQPVLEVLFINQERLARKVVNYFIRKKLRLDPANESALRSGDSELWRNYQSVFVQPNTSSRARY